jgi:hypothetical protein
VSEPEQIDTSDEACAIACMLVSNPQGAIQQLWSALGADNQTDALTAISAFQEENARLSEDNVQLHARVGIGVTVGGGHIVYGSHEAIKRVQNILLIDSTHPIEKEDVRRSLLRDVQAAEARLQRAASIIRDFVTETRAYSSPECDDEGAPGAAELKAADAFLSEIDAKIEVRDA